jgi:2-oxoglutarate/2-oxoacid ferredoxin oxidoreductase subunit alpha
MISKSTSAAWRPSTFAPSRRKRRWEELPTEDAELIVVGYGIVSRVLRSAVDEARKQGWKVGLFRPITLWPFPSRRSWRQTARRAEKVLTWSN